MLPTSRTHEAGGGARDCGWREMGAAGRGGAVYIGGGRAAEDAQWLEGQLLVHSQVVAGCAVGHCRFLRDAQKPGWERKDAGSGLADEPAVR
eukprot:scaffold44_cov411-Prasinococcus_capsulatus_cf.AAC.42